MCCMLMESVCCLVVQLEVRWQGLMRWARRQVRDLLGQAEQAESRSGQQTMEVWLNGKPIKPVPVVTVHTAEQLMEYVKQSQPVVIKNFQDGFASRDQWTREGACPTPAHSTAKALAPSRPAHDKLPAMAW